MWGPKEQQAQNAGPVPKIVLEIGADGTYAINTRPVVRDRLEERLRQIYANRGDRVLFVKAAPTAPDHVVQRKADLPARDRPLQCGGTPIGGRGASSGGPCW